jgi:hypothetical protein
MSELWGWRLAVVLVTVAAAAVTVLAWATLPPMTMPRDETQTVRGGRRHRRNRRLVTLTVLTLIGVTGHFISYTFIVVIIHDVLAPAWRPSSSSFVRSCCGERRPPRCRRCCRRPPCARRPTIRTARRAYTSPGSRSASWPVRLRAGCSTSMPALMIAASTALVMVALTCVTATRGLF